MTEGTVFSPHRNKSRIVCTVFECKSTQCRDRNIRFHSFPKNNPRCNEWIKALGLQKNVRPTTRVCSLHFRVEDYKENWIPGVSVYRQLKDTAVPSCNLPQLCTEDEEEDSVVQCSSSKRRRKEIVNPSIIKKSSLVRNRLTEPTTENSLMSQLNGSISPSSSEEVTLKKNAELTLPDPSMNAIVDPLIEDSANDEIFSPAKEKLSGLCRRCKSELAVQTQEQGNMTDFQGRDTRDVATIMMCDSVSQVIKCNVATQTPDNSKKYSIIDNLKTDKHLSTATGLESFLLLNTIEDLASQIAKPAHWNNKITLREKIIMTYLMLKQNVSYLFLALLFDCCSPQHCQRIFFDTIQVLSAIMKVFTGWPGRDEIKCNLPKCFHDFEDVVVVLDCTEIYIQNSSSLSNQILTYSNYKGSTTWKVMTGVSPAGNIIFISKIYGGRSSDKAIFEQSELVKLLKPGDAIMVDKGFLIDDLCVLNGWSLVRPPFLKDKQQMSFQDVQLTSKIARARIHVERSNQRLKVFRILGSTMSNCLFPVVQDIFTVICGTINLSAPILEDEKFMKNYEVQ